ncbi:MAG: nucleoside-diphosphate sugar epimerase/dehydratase [Acidimicrobiia bacterium]|nr:nucleoside-diphosphate sugar epimerase/dehydratase [Acidimicrobiia bacterium]
MGGKVAQGVNNGAATTGGAIASAASRVRADIAFALVDVFVVVASYTLGLGLRMIDPLVGDTTGFWSDLMLAMPVIIALHLAANVLAGAYGHVWEHASTSEAMRVAVANAATSSVLIGLSWMARELTGFVIPYSVLVVGGLGSLLAMGMVRFRSRLFSFKKIGDEAIRVLVVGLGQEAATFARSVPRIGGPRRVVGFIGDLPGGNHQKRRLAGAEVLGGIDDISEIATEYEVDEVVVIGSDARLLRRVVDLCLDVDVRLRVLPAAQDIMQDGATAVDVRDIRVEDILVRDAVDTDLTQVASILEGKKILVTGAGGSIGSEVVRQVLSYAPSGVWALDRDETLLHEARLKWEGSTNLILGDVRRGEQVLRVFEAVQPDVVFHAAALKHVPILEEFPEEAVLTNIAGTRNVIEAGSRNGMERFVLISTDKAVSPSSVMGATKRVAELMTQVGHERDDGCVYSAVRFGNVLGSRGSVIPTFISQIQSGGPVTVTDPAMTRYFMTVDEAVQLVLQAAALANGSEVFLLDMGEPVNIEDLARRLIRLAGLSPDRDIEITYTGRRPGEKLSEMLALDPMMPTSHEKVFEVRLDVPEAHVLLNEVALMEDSALGSDTRSLLSRLTAVANANFDGFSTELDLEPGEVRRVASWS